MQQFIRKVFGKIGWGAPASAAIHIMLVILLLQWPQALSAPEIDESVDVELVPPQPRVEAAEEKKKLTENAPPNAFESATGVKELLDKEEMSTDEPRPSLNKPDAQEADAQSPEQQKEAVHKQEQNSQPSTLVSTDTGDDLRVEKQQTPNTSDQPKTVEPIKEQSTLISAKQIYSKDTLSDPRVKQAIGKLHQRDRIIQICGIEALEQIRHSRPGTFPDMLAPNAGIVAKTHFTIRDGAFRSRAKWYAVSFDCEVDEEAMNITKFSYSIGKAIPNSEWHSRQLPTD
jgi:hypothetical protein